jgi:hypothetical protein
MTIRYEHTLPAQATREPALPAAFERRVLSLAREADWDGEDADAITTDCCEAALQFVRQVLAKERDLPLPFPAPSAYGAVSLRWINGDTDFAVYVYSQDRVETLSQQPDGRYGRLPARPLDAIEQLLAFRSQTR